MTWRTRLRPGDFRGATFHTLDRSGSGGRRNVHHEYPKRDEPDVEDFGRRQRRWNLTAYVIGANYMAERDALIDALDAGGPGRYVDHWRGELRAVVDSYEYRELSTEGGFCIFNIDFAESGSDGAGAVATAAFALISPAAASLVASTVSTFKARYGR